MTVAPLIREHLVAALEADLVGPFNPAASEPEVLTLAPSRWYLTGFLVPEGQRTSEDPIAEDDGGAGSEAKDDESVEEHVQKHPKLFPASVGMSVLLPPATGGRRDTVTVQLRWAEYVDESIESAPGRERTKPIRTWRRIPRGPETITLPLDPKAIETGEVVPNTSGIWIGGQLGMAEGLGLPPGTRALSIFVVNRRAPADPRLAEADTIFQVELQLQHAGGLLGRPNLTGLATGDDPDDLDDRVSDLQYRDHCEYAVGHGIACRVPDPLERGRPVTRVRTTWLPQAEVRRVETVEQDGVVTAMEELASLREGEQVEHALGHLVEAYGTWISQQRAMSVDDPGRAEVVRILMERADLANRRIAAGIALLVRDPEVRTAFCLMNEAMAMTRHQIRPNESPKWRLFQLAFVLLNLEGIAHPHHEDRKAVELIFFPTGGGKTEAYLGVIAFTLLLRRLRGQARPDGGRGVAVLLRYTLRLLTLDQLGRAASLVCALELLRKRQPARLGTTRLSIGLWVGRSATANTLADVADLVRDFKKQRGGSPCPLSECPWCRHPIGPDALTLTPNTTNPEELRVACTNRDCAFNGAQSGGDGLPVLFVDEQIYRELPAFLVATVDKFAMLPWRGDTGKLFGRAVAVEGRRFFGGADAIPKTRATALPNGLRPPELIVQDELHLISGPLGTMVGLYETAIDALCTDRTQGHSIPPKILASTATVRRAHKQTQALFGRPTMHLFPPPGVDAFETFFATVKRSEGEPGRLYLGVAAAGRSMKQILLRTYVALLGAGRRCWDPAGPADQAANGYTTVAGYFNSLRELGGMRRLVEDDVRTRAREAELRHPSSHAGPHPWVTKRSIGEPVELTSRERTDTIAGAKRRLEQHLASSDHVDVLLASNMISVGIDIERLGLMVVAGQPKTSSEYIQATSRVGRDKRWPGLVVTCFNLHKPRDRSHYERFSAYHESFYRYVEATSLTPFSARALDRGLAALLVTMIRLDDPDMTASDAVMKSDQVRGWAESVREKILARVHVQPACAGDPEPARRVRARIDEILDRWIALVESDGAKRIYSDLDRPKRAGRALLRNALEAMAEPLDELERTFIAPTSMRDVEGTVHVWVERNVLGKASL